MKLGHHVSLSLRFNRIVLLIVKRLLKEDDIY